MLLVFVYNIMRIMLLKGKEERLYIFYASGCYKTLMLYEFLIVIYYEWRKNYGGYKKRH